MNKVVVMYALFDCELLLDTLIKSLSLRCLDVRVLMADDAAFQDGILDALQEYNTKQYITVKLPGQENQVTSINLHKIH